MKLPQRIRSVFPSALVALACAAGTATSFAAPNEFKQTNLVSDIPGLATYTDPNLVNPWGLAASGGSPMWVSNGGTGTSTIYNGIGTPSALVVTIPAPLGAQGKPTGQIFNGTTAFNGDRFVFATENGTIAGWRGALGTNAETLFDMSTAGAIYKGLAFGTAGANSYLYATDFHNARIDVFGSSGAPAMAGSFIDPLLPAGYAPFNIQNLGGRLFVTYAMQDADAEDDVAGAGHGFISTFDLSGNFLGRLASGGALDSPWGLALAPSGFGPFGGQLLVGNFGDGTINAYNRVTGAYLDTLRDTLGDPLMIDGLWGLRFGNGAGSGSLDTLYFAAGIAGGGAVEDHGLYGAINAVPEPSTYGALAVVALLGVVVRRRLRR